MTKRITHWLLLAAFIVAFYFSLPYIHVYHPIEDSPLYQHPDFSNYSSSSSSCEFCRDFGGCLPKEMCIKIPASLDYYRQKAVRESLLHSSRMIEPVEPYSFTRSKWSSSSRSSESSVIQSVSSSVTSIPSDGSSMTSKTLMDAGYYHRAHRWELNCKNSTLPCTQTGS